MCFPNDRVTREIYVLWFNPNVILKLSQVREKAPHIRDSFKVL